MDTTHLVGFFILSLGSLFTIINPFSTAFVFLNITNNNTKRQKAEIARKAAFTAGSILIVFAIAGDIIMNFFSITISAFAIAGGLLVANVGFKMMNEKDLKDKGFRDDSERKEAAQKEDVSVVPLAIPMLSGPGALTTTLVLMGQSRGLADKFAVLAAICIICICTFFILSNAETIEKKVSKNARNIIEKVIGLIIIVVGIQFIINGIGSLLEFWGFI